MAQGRWGIPGRSQGSDLAQPTLCPALFKVDVPWEPRVPCQAPRGQQGKPRQRWELQSTRLSIRSSRH